MNVNDYDDCTKEISTDFELDATLFMQLAYRSCTPVYDIKAAKSFA